jgi:hypothetical protein
MTRLVSTLFLFQLTISPAATAETRPRGNLRKEFQVVYDDQAERLARRDAHGWMEFNAPDHSVKLLDGRTISRDQLEDGMTRFFTSGQLVRQIAFTYRVLEVTPTDSGAVVVVEQRDHRIQMRKDGKPHRVEAHVIHRDTWTRTSDGWKRHLTEEVKQTRFTVDGRPPRKT